MSGIQMILAATGAGGTPPGQQAYTANGTYSWVAPSGVTSVSAVAVGPGRNSGGGLGWRNNITVVPGTSYTVVVGKGGGTQASQACFTCSYFIDTSTVRGGKGAQCTGGTYTGAGGGNGGRQNGGPNGGAGGYTGDGGAGATTGFSYGTITNRAGSAGAGGGGGGGGVSIDARCCCVGVIFYNGGGGGVGLLGQGCNGAAGASGGGGGGGGSGGGAGGYGGPNTYGCGGSYGGGGKSAVCANAAVRIIWPGSTRSFPSTCTGNL